MHEEDIFSCWRCGNPQDYEGTCDWCSGNEGSFDDDQLIDAENAFAELADSDGN